MDAIAVLIMSQIVLIPILGGIMLGIRTERKKNLRVLRNALVLASRKYR